jgi:esterase
MKLYYHFTGHGHPLVILHGLFGSSDNWYTLSNFFGEKHKVYAVDQRNHGRSPHSDDFNYKVMADDINNLLIHEGIKSVFLLGHSMGGKTAMQFALSHREKVDKLIVVDIAPRAYPPQHDAIFEALFALKLASYKTRTELDSALAQQIPDYAVRQLLLKNVSRDGNGKFGWKMDVRSIHRNYNNVNVSLDSDTPFDKPALFIRGEKSHYIGEGDIAGIKRLFPSAILTTIEGAGHWVHAEAPQRFAETVMEFLAAD